MNDLSAHLRTVTRLTFVFLSLCCIGWAIWPSYQSLFGGLGIGAMSSLVNASHLSWKVQRIGANAAEQGAKRNNLGFFTRACIGLLAAVVSTKYFSFSIIGTVAGLFVAQLATLILGFGSKNRPVAVHSSDERGENK